MVKTDLKSDDEDELGGEDVPKDGRVDVRLFVPRRRPIVDVSVAKTDDTIKHVHVHVPDCEGYIFEYVNGKKKNKKS